ncbi:LOW QUALITY PROTEIN: uncharacterized protein LOC112556022 [Pomacea canaliculata]|uniref:LOW QUALITY PROTEIN: uncharacterized protein LOC112556022 n=1 Tax=Pomacea canaliculata TaxID=400727 RepID=UPI000D736F2A|nr:LOW QUALITY PROTEIN: uncharacterized protein LOC112556022 [Pomacea canaliculata]
MAATGFQDLGPSFYFIAKCDSMDALRRCITSGVWASRERSKPPQPHHILAEVFSEGPVILIFSVNNCHGWHGYASMLSPPNREMKVSEEDGSGQCYHESVVEGKKNEDSFSTNSATEYLNLLGTGVEDASDDGKQISLWHHFKIHWHKQFLTDFGERSLSFENTKHFALPDSTPVNKARNWQQITPVVGRQICQLLDDHYASLVERRQKAVENKQASNPAPFLNMDGCAGREHGEHWKMIVQKVEHELGRVHLACPYGSQRYNLQNENSDIDAFVVYQAHTRDLLSFNPPKGTVKNSERETCDYTILELHRYCELLLSSDARCVETLFLMIQPIIQASPEWRQLQQHRQQFLNRKCLEKYLGDALGSNGVKRLQHYVRENPGITSSSTLPRHISKLAYIIVRLLQNAEDIVMGRQLEVFRNNSSNNKMLLLRIRTSNLTLSEINTHIEKLVSTVQEGKENVPEDLPSVKANLEKWMLFMRFLDFQQFPPQS